MPVVAKLDTRKRGVDSAMPGAAIVARPDISERCADNVRNWSVFFGCKIFFWDTKDQRDFLGAPKFFF